MSNVIQYHPKYMERLAKIYLQKYGMYGYEDAKAWFHDFLSKEMQVKIKPYIRAAAGDSGLDYDE